MAIGSGILGGNEGGGGGINYTTAEQDTGLKWIDGKTIYQKTVDVGSMPDTTPTTKFVAHGVTGIDIGYITIVPGGSFMEASGIVRGLPWTDEAAGRNIEVDVDVTDSQWVVNIDISGK